MRKSKKRDDNIHVITNDSMARQDHKDSRDLSLHALKTIRPLTQAQRQMMESYFSGSSILATGSAGSGKSLIALYLALTDMLDKNQPIDNIKIVRSIVATRDIGHLPGDLEEKISVYEAPYRELVAFLFDKPTAYNVFKEKGKIEFLPTSFLRGQTWDNSVIIVDEVQNLNPHEINTVMTRVGMNSRIILAGDSKQSDLFKTSRDISCIELLERVLSSNKFFDTVHFTRNDIVRSDFVKAWIECTEDS